MLKHIPFYASLLGRQLTTTIKATHSHVLVYGAIEVHSFGEMGCIASNKTIAEETGLKQSSVATVISTLAKAGWVAVELDENNHRLSIEPLMVIEAPLYGHKTPLQSPLSPNGDLTGEKRSLEDSNRKTVIDTVNVVKNKEDKDSSSGYQTFFKQPKQKKQSKSLWNKKPPGTSGITYEQAKEVCQMFANQKGGAYLGGLDVEAIMPLIEEHGIDTVRDAMQFAINLEPKEFQIEINRPAHLAQKWPKLIELMESVQNEKQEHEKAKSKITLVDPELAEAYFRDPYAFDF